MSKFKNNLIFIPLIGVIFISLFLMQPSVSHKEVQKSNIVTLEFKEGVSFEVDKPLLPYVKEFIYEYLKYNSEESLILSIKSFEGIYEDVTPYGTYGVTLFREGCKQKDYILINPLVTNTDRKKKLLVFHEMAHKFLAKEHCHRKCNQIISDLLNNDNFYNDWEYQKIVLFKDIPH